MGQRRRGLALLGKVYEELYASLGEDAEPLQLLELAQVLIDLSEDPYKFTAIEEARSASNYYTSDTDSKLEFACWEVLANERLHSNLDDRDYDRAWQRRLRASDFLRGEIDVG